MFYQKETWAGSVRSREDKQKIILCKYKICRKIWLCTAYDNNKEVTTQTKTQQVV